MLKIIKNRRVRVRRSKTPDPTPALSALAAVEEAQVRRADEAARQQVAAADARAAELARVALTDRITEAQAAQITTRHPFVAPDDTTASLLLPRARKPMSRVTATVILAFLILTLLALVIWAAHP